MAGAKEQFESIEVGALSAAALQRAEELGCEVAQVRVEQIVNHYLSLRDARVETAAEDVEIGVGIRVLHDGSVGFAASVELGASSAVALVDQAFEAARASARVRAARVELAEEPSYGEVSWDAPHRIDPTGVAIEDRVGLLGTWSEQLLASDHVDHVFASLHAVNELKYYADLAGTTTRQSRVRVHPAIEALALEDDGHFESLRTITPPRGVGYEYLLGEGASLQAEIDALPELLAEKLKAAEVKAGDYDVVIDPSNLWLTIHESVGHATELDRALGYEAAYAGTSFATPDQIGHLVYGSALMHVTGDRTAEGGLASIGYDDEGVASQRFDLVRDGMLVGFQLDRQFAKISGAARSNGCAFADSPLHAPIQRMANISLASAGSSGPSTEELISSVKDGIYIVGDKSWSIDMQRYNFQFTGQRFYAIKDGHIAGQLRDAAYQATTTQFWGSLIALGGEQTYVLGGAMNCGKGQPGQVAPVSHGCPSALFRAVRILNTREVGKPLSSGLEAPHVVIERALERATAPCVVIVEDEFNADLRFANNTATTNGVRHDRKVTVVSFMKTRAGVATGSVTRSGSVDLDDLLAAAEHEAASASAAEDESELLVSTVGDPDFELAPEDTGMSIFEPLLEELGEAFSRARSEGTVLYGYGEHEVSTSYLGTSTGFRERFVQPTGSFELVARADGGARSSWAARGSVDFADVSVAAMDARLRERLSWAERSIELPAGRYEVILPPDAVADLLIELWSAMSGADAQDGGNVFSAPGGKTRLGDRLTDQAFSLLSDPELTGLSCSPVLMVQHSSRDQSVFDNGARLSKCVYLDAGELVGLRYHRAGARKSGQPFLAPVDNLQLSVPGATASLDDLVAHTERGLLLTCLWYIREVDPSTLLLTGLTRDGIYLVEDGQVIGAVNNFRFNESPLDLLKNAIEVGASERALSREWGEWMNRTAMPPLRVADFNMSSVSPAN